MIKIYLKLVSFVFKGGYCIESLSEGVAMTLRSLLGYPCPRIEKFVKPDPTYNFNDHLYLFKKNQFLYNKRIAEIIQNVKSVLRPYWTCLQVLNETNDLKLEDYLKSIEYARLILILLSLK
jgi:histone deacetylase 6